MSCNKILENYNNEKNKISDINEHLSTLKKYAEECKHITEFGVRWIVSTWAFLASNPEKMISYDFQMPSTWDVDINTVLEICYECNINYDFILADTRNITIEETDLLFIDTLHEYEQVKKELELHSDKVMKYIIFHDTVSFRTVGEVGGKGIYFAIEEFLQKNNQWKIKEEFFNNNGLLIIERVI
jgi:hypothetical protein